MIGVWDFCLTIGVCDFCLTIGVCDVCLLNELNDFGETLEGEDATTILLLSSTQ